MRVKPEVSNDLWSCWDVGKETMLNPLTTDDVRMFPHGEGTVVFQLIIPDAARCLRQLIPSQEACGDTHLGETV